MEHSTGISELTDKEIFHKTLSNGISNILMDFIYFAVIFLIGYLSWWLAVILGGIWLLITLADAAMFFLANVIPSFILVGFVVSGKKTVKEGEKYLAAAGFVRLIEISIGFLGAYLLYRIYF